MSDTPLTRCAAAAVPLLIEAHTELHGLAAPKASRLANRIGGLLAELIEVASDVEAYGKQWSAQTTLADLAAKLRAATAEYNQVMTD